MRINMVIGDKLIADTLRATGFKTKRGAVDQGLRLLLQMQSQAENCKLRGKLQWEGDLDAMRTDN